MNFLKFLRYLLIITFIFLPLNGCKKVKWKGDFEPDGKKRAKQNVKEGKGFSGVQKKLKGVRSGNGVFDFASSNELWRASLDTLDFMSFSNVDYSGGLIITDWYSENQNNQSIKITVRFLSNEIRADGLKVSLHQRICGTSNSCAITEVKSSLSDEIKVAILRKATLMKKEKDENNPRKEYKKKGLGEVRYCGDGKVIGC